MKTRPYALFASTFALALFLFAGTASADVTSGVDDSLQAPTACDTCGCKKKHDEADEGECGCGKPKGECGCGDHGHDHGDKPEDKTSCAGGCKKAGCDKCDGGCKKGGCDKCEKGCDKCEKGCDKCDGGCDKAECGCGKEKGECGCGGDKAAKAPMAFDAPPAVGTKATCPVMGGEFTVTEKTDRSEHKGKHYVFCCAGCKPKFDAAPESYLAK